MIFRFYFYCCIKSTKVPILCSYYILIKFIKLFHCHPAIDTNEIWKCIEFIELSNRRETERKNKTFQLFRWWDQILFVYLFIITSQWNISWIVSTIRCVVLNKFIWNMPDVKHKRHLWFGFDSIFKPKKIYYQRTQSMPIFSISFLIYHVIFLALFKLPKSTARWIVMDKNNIYKLGFTVIGKVCFMHAIYSFRCVCMRCIWFAFQIYIFLKFC